MAELRRWRSHQGAHNHSFHRPARSSGRPGRQLRAIIKSTEEPSSSSSSSGTCQMMMVVAAVRWWWRYIYSQSTTRGVEDRLSREFSSCPTVEESDNEDIRFGNSFRPRPALWGLNYSVDYYIHSAKYPCQLKDNACDMSRFRWIELTG